MRKFKFKGSRLYKYLRPFTSWHFIISFGFAWMLTNGWAYLIAFTPLVKIQWIVWFARWYVGIEES